jgi:hypothetical protein
MRARYSNTQKLYTLLTECIYGFHIIFRTNRDYLPKQQGLVDLILMEIHNDFFYRGTEFLSTGIAFTNHMCKKNHVAVCVCVCVSPTPY